MHQIIIVSNKEEFDQDYLQSLKQKGYAVDAVKKGNVAIDAIRDLPYGLIIIDIDPPEMTDFQLIAMARSNEDTQQTPILGLIDPNSSNEKEYMNFGLNGFVKKPLTVEILLETIKNTLPDEEESCSADALDVSVLEQLEGDLGVEIVQQLITSFLDDSSLRVEAIVKAVKDMDYQVVLDEAHSLKSSSGSFGAAPLHQFARKLEVVCEAGVRDDIVSTTNNLEEMAGKTFSALKTRYDL